MIEDTVLWFLEMILGGVNSASDVLSRSLTSGEAYRFAEEVYKNIAFPIGVQLLVLYLIVALLRESSRLEDVGIRTLFKPFLKFIIAAVVMSKGIEIFSELSKASNTLIKGFDHITLSGGGTIKEAMEHRAELMNSMVGIDGFAIWDEKAEAFIAAEKIGMKGIFIFFKLLLPGLIGFIANIIISVVAYGRMFEMLLRFSFMPIPIASMYEDGTASAGFRYLKVMAALAFQGVLILGVTTLYTAFVTMSFGPGKQFGLFPYLGLSLAYATIIGKTNSISRELFGV